LPEIPGVVAQFEEGARRSLAAGFDGVEIHGANGYLIDQFLRDGSNRRTDEYGGPVEQRARFLLEGTAAVIRAGGADRVGVRVSPLSAFNGMSDGDPKETFGYAATALGRLGLAYLHAVLPGSDDPTSEAHAMAGFLRERFGGTFLVNG